MTPRSNVIRSSGFAGNTLPNWWNWFCLHTHVWHNRSACAQSSEGFTFPGSVAGLMLLWIARNRRAYSQSIVVVAIHLLWSQNWKLIIFEYTLSEAKPESSLLKSFRILDTPWSNEELGISRQDLEKLKYVDVGTWDVKLHARIQTKKHLLVRFESSLFFMYLHPVNCISSHIWIISIVENVSWRDKERWECGNL